MSSLLVRQAEEKQYPSSQGPCSFRVDLPIRTFVSIATDSSSSSILPCAHNAYLGLQGETGATCYLSVDLSKKCNTTSPCLTNIPHLPTSPPQQNQRHSLTF